MSGRPSAPKRKMPAKKPTQTAAKASKANGDGKTTRRVVEAPKPRRNIPIVGIAFGVIALLLVAAVVLTGDVGPGSETGEPTVQGDFLPLFSSPQGDPAVGLPAPTLTGESIDGETISVGPTGSPTAIVFLAHWCAHCQVEVPRVQQWLDAGGGVDGVEILSVSTSINSARGNYPPSEWLSNAGWEADVLKDSTDNTAHSAYGGGGFPYWVFLNADGTVASRSSGELDIATLEAFMQQIAVTAS
ncbi:MAG: TlpA family protein disulfide reductase [bacterium]|nr:TlpA family protein disulfide reductase [bacterium]